MAGDDPLTRGRGPERAAEAAASRRSSIPSRPPSSAAARQGARGCCSSSCSPLAIAMPFVVREDRWVTLLTVVVTYVVLASGLNIVVGFTGLLDLGYVAFYAIGAYYTAIIFQTVLVNEVRRRHRPVLVADVGEPSGGRPAGGPCRRAHRLPDAARARRLPGDHDAGLRRDHPHRGQQLGGPDARPVGHSRHPRARARRLPLHHLEEPLLPGPGTGARLAVDDLAHRALAHRPGLDRHPRGRGGRRGDGHPHLALQAARRMRRGPSSPA